LENNAKQSEKQRGKDVKDAKVAVGNRLEKGTSIDRKKGMFKSR
jgi:hypothetical protein